MADTTKIAFMEPRLPYKGYARVFVKTEDDSRKLKSIIKKIDLYEYEHYYPAGLIATLDQYPDTVYTGKFDFPEGFAKAAKEAGIRFVIVEKREELSFPYSAIEDALNPSLDHSKIVTDLLSTIYAGREEILKAFVAKYGTGPDEVEQVIQSTESGWTYSVRKKSELN
jgi:hypothetical protein